MLLPPKDLAVGSVHKTKNCGNIEIVAYRGAHDIDVLFLDSDIVKTTQASHIRSGKLSDKPMPSMKVEVGDIWNTNQYGDIHVLQKLQLGRYLVMFLDTCAIRTTRGDKIKLGRVQDHTRLKKNQPKKKRVSKYAVGTVHQTNKCGKVKVFESIDQKSVIVEFLDTKSRRSCSIANLQQGRVWDYFMPSVHHVGYIGNLPHGATMDGSKSSKPYSVWRSMLARCYGNYDKYISYHDCEVCEEWHCFANFLKWFNDTYPFDYDNPDDPIHLDKDIIDPTARFYSPETCSWVPASENVMEMIKRKWKVHMLKSFGK